MNQPLTTLAGRAKVLERHFYTDGSEAARSTRQSRYVLSHACLRLCMPMLACLLQPRHVLTREPGVVKHPRDLRQDEKEPKEKQFFKAISGLPVNLFMPGEARHPHFPEFRLVWAEGKKTSGEPWKAASGLALTPPTITPSAVPGQATNAGDAVLTGRVLIYHGPCPTDSLNVPDVHWPN